MSFRTQYAVLLHSTLPSSDKFILSLIAFTENEKSGRCDPSVDKIAFYHNTETRNIRKRLNVIVEAGELVIAGRNGHSNHYYIPLYPGEPGWYDPGPCQDTGTHKCNGHHGPIINRTERDMQDTPRWQEQQSRKQEVRQATQRQRRDVLQDRGGEGMSSRTGVRDVLQDRGGCPPGQGGDVLQDSQNRNGTGMEQEKEFLQTTAAANPTHARAREDEAAAAWNDNVLRQTAEQIRVRLNMPLRNLDGLMDILRQYPETPQYFIAQAAACADKLRKRPLHLAHFQSWLERSKIARTRAEEQGEHHDTANENRPSDEDKRRAAQADAERRRRLDDGVAAIFEKYSRQAIG